MCEDIQADVEDGQLQFFYILAFVLQGDKSTHCAGKKNFLGFLDLFFAKYLLLISVEGSAFTCTLLFNEFHFLHAHVLQEDKISRPNTYNDF